MFAAAILPETNTCIASLLDPSSVLSDDPSVLSLVWLVVMGFWTTSRVVSPFSSSTVAGGGREDGMLEADAGSSGGGGVGGSNLSATKMRARRLSVQAFFL